MKYRQKLGYMTLGGFIAVVGMITTLLATTITAQTELPEVIDLIRCKRLAIVNDDNEVVVHLLSEAHGGGITVANNTGKPVVMVGVDDNRGSVSVGSDKYTPAASMGANPHGGSVSVYGNFSSNEAFGGILVDDVGAGLILADKAGDIATSLP